MSKLRVILRAIGLDYASEVDRLTARETQQFNNNVRMANEVIQAAKERDDSEDRLCEAEAEVERLKADNDRLTQDIMLAARTESMAVERAWHASKLVKLLKERLALANPTSIDQGTGT